MAMSKTSKPGMSDKKAPATKPTGGPVVPGKGPKPPGQSKPTEGTPKMNKGGGKKGC